MKNILKAAVAAVVFGTTINAQAQAVNPATDTVNVQATVNKNCTVSGDDISISTTPALTGSNLSNTASVQVQCTRTTPYTLTFSDGSTLTDNLLALTAPAETSGATPLEATLTIGTTTSNRADGIGAGFGVAAQAFTIKATLNDAEVKQAVPATYNGTATLTVTY